MSARRRRSDHAAGPPGLGLGGRQRACPRPAGVRAVRGRSAGRLRPGLDGDGGRCPRRRAAGQHPCDGRPGAGGGGRLPGAAPAPARAAAGGRPARHGLRGRAGAERPAAGAVAGRAAALARRPALAPGLDPPARGRGRHPGRGLCRRAERLPVAVPCAGGLDRGSAAGWGRERGVGDAGVRPGLCRHRHLAAGDGDLRPPAGRHVERRSVPGGGLAGVGRRRPRPPVRHGDDRRRALPRQPGAGPDAGDDVPAADDPARPGAGARADRAVAGAAGDLGPGARCGGPSVPPAAWCS